MDSFRRLLWDGKNVGCQSLTTISSDGIFQVEITTTTAFIGIQKPPKKNDFGMEIITEKKDLHVNLLIIVMISYEQYNVRGKNTEKLNGNHDACLWTPWFPDGSRAKTTLLKRWSIIMKKYEAVSAANISQLTFFVTPDGCRARTVLPADEGANSEIAESLKNLGFKIDREVGDSSSGAELWTNADSDSSLEEAICSGATLFFSKAGITKLIEGGVSTPTLNALKDITY